MWVWQWVGACVRVVSDEIGRQGGHVKGRGGGHSTTSRRLDHCNRRNLREEYKFKYV